ncbi:MAG: cobalamin biosynthesis protein [Thermoguttaceae bacterium]
MNVAVITLSDQGTRVAGRLAQRLAACDVYVHVEVPLPAGLTARRFDSVVELTAEVFSKYPGLVYVMPCGVAVRAVGPLIRDKHSDPAVVVLDVAARWAVSLLGGHEGGANRLAVEVANILGAEPVISTTTEAAKTLIAGIGCRRGTEAERIVKAIHAAVELVGKTVGDIRLLASIDLKGDEAGLLEAADRLEIPLRLLTSGEICGSTRSFARSSFVEEKVGLPAVAEPAALLAGKRTELLLPKQIFEGVTVALARESRAWED